MNPSREDFCHPYQPYEIQLDFMNKLYRCIEHEKVGIFESPTGTGKSLSLICGALTWLRDHERRSLHPTDDGDGTVDWLAQAEASARRREILLEREELEHRLAALRRQEAKRSQANASLNLVKKARLFREQKLQHQSAEDDFILDDYNSDEENDHLAPTTSNSGLSTSTQALLDKLQAPSKPQVEEQEHDRLKLIICSRTHSQLTQFVNELRRVKPPSILSPAVAEQAPENVVEESVKHLPLGSRKTLCINSKVNRLTSATAINDQCLELQKPGTSKDKRCPYLPAKDDKERLGDFRNAAIARIRDIEDIGSLGQRMELCPYYASRNAIPSTEVLTLPYPLLLQKSARNALGVSVKDNIVIIDEAHNLMDAIADTYSISLQLCQLQEAARRTTAYVARFKNRLKGKNRVYVTQVIRLLNSITDCLRATMKLTPPQETTVTATQLMSGKGVDQIKPHKLLQYLYESKLAHKVEGYTEAQGQQEAKSSPAKGVLMHFQNFLVVLMNPDDEGRFFIGSQEGEPVVRYTLLDPREHFREIVREARSVVLAGGTMSPMSDYSDYLFSYLEKDQLQTHSFGHVIPESNLFAKFITKGPSNIEFDFTYNSRSSESMILELGRLVLRACQTVPDGVVAFFPSYDYLAKVTSIWQRSPTSQPMMAMLQRAKRTFQESRGVSVDDLLRDYAAAVDSGYGGLMLSVVGGKLSEGINFSDKLGRAVIAVGLPFPNSNGAEWKAKMQYVEAIQYKQCKDLKGMDDSSCRAEARRASRNFYDNACMRAVNQSIGRVIRHRNDYAAILLVDRRFATDRIRQKLPGWIQESMNRDVEAWAKIEDGLGGFFGHRWDTTRAIEL
ncbi:uncharacterized protein A1O9_00864 [Exophiala aquamarina CBS 119918]|uniref:ATP-dependent DNA helicase CHL1 n=1 Tax=Exophiala aquamarina CBS 119918 TaxID=1182545 RepID=A0A072Q4Q7_9EURO|nr:uncharacterized protein A1O9_00864 [Exophiala aquamarina CBS 119918]KEF62890.1 hypothetical protein A1O9_00864 [Exophiala aquamarina CBS 119918]